MGLKYLWRLQFNLSYNTGMSQKFCNILVSFLFFSTSYNKSSRRFIRGYTVWRQIFYLFLHPVLILVCVLLSEELFYWSFHLCLIVEASQEQEISHESEQVMIQGSYVQTIYWLWHQFNSLKFLESILKTSTYAKLLTHPNIYSTDISGKYTMNQTTTSLWN